MNRKTSSTSTIISFIFIGLVFLAYIVWKSILPAFVRNQDGYKALEKKFIQQQVTLAEKRAIANNLPKFQEEVIRMEKLINPFNKELIRDPKELETILPKIFLKNGYALDSFQFDGPGKESDQYWQEYAVDFNIVGPKEKFLATVKEWRVNLPYTVQLKEIEISMASIPQNNSKKEQLKAHIFGSALVTAPFSLDAIPDDLQEPTEDAFGLTQLEKYYSKRLRQDSEKYEEEIVRLNKVIGDQVFQLKHKKFLLKYLKAREPYFQIERNQTFDSLEKQLPDQLQHLSPKNPIRITL